MQESNGVSAPTERGSVYDFLYHDPRRIASFLSQFTQYGQPEKLSRSEATAENSSAKKVRTGKAGISPFAYTRTGERAESESATESLTTTYDPLWQNALALLDYLHQQGLIQREVAQARIGQFVLVQGQLDVLNLETLHRALNEQPIKKIALAGAGGAPGRRRGQERDAMEAGLSFVKILPHSIHATVRSATSVWCCLQSAGMVTSADDLLLKHGITVQGNWSLLGVLDAGPGHRSTASSSGSLASDAEGLVKAMRTLGPLAREALGRPADHYGVTPLLIFREAG